MLLHRKQTYQWKLKTWFEYFVKFLSILLADKFFKIPKSFKYQKQLPEMFYKESVLSSLSKFTGKDLCQSFLFKCFPVNFERFSRTPFSQNTSGRLLLKYCSPIFLSLKMNQETKKQETLRVVTIAMIWFTLASFWKFQYFRRSIYSPVEYPWWSFCYENSKPWSIFLDVCLGFWIHLCFQLKTLQNVLFL